MKMFFNLESGTIQGPFQFAIHMSPIFDIEDLSFFADDNYIVKCNKNLENVKKDTKNSLNKIIKWLKASGLKGNSS
jgi:hypothetical protein